MLEEEKYKARLREGKLAFLRVFVVIMDLVASGPLQTAKCCITTTSPPIKDYTLIFIILSYTMNFSNRANRMTFPCLPAYQYRSDSSKARRKHRKSMQQAKTRQMWYINIVYKTHLLPKAKSFLFLFLKYPSYPLHHQHVPTSSFSEHYYYHLVIQSFPQHHLQPFPHSVEYIHNPRY